MSGWKKLFTAKIFLVFFVGIVLLFFYPVFLSRKIPIPADTIVGMYHPWIDNVWDNFASGVPFKNFLITDPVRQQYVWRKEVIDQFKTGNLPIWNPYSFSGTPLLANFQSAAFYPLNFLFFVLPFNFAWTVLVILQPLLSGLFLFLYLRHLDISKPSSLLGAIVFSFGAFSTVWLEWNTIGHVILWMPLILLSVEKIFSGKTVTWSAIFVFSLVSSFFAGHLQIFFYGLLLTIAYILGKIIFLKNKKAQTLLLFTLCFMLFAAITSIQWLPTLQFILSSARGFDQGSWLKEGWFIPWQNLIQFLAPDYFGNPATNNYWGVWNYAEFAGYVGIVPLIFALFALIFRKDKKTLFFGSIAFLSLIFALPTPLAKLPFVFNLPLISTSQPTRLLFLSDFALAILAALGMDYFVRQKSSIIAIIKLLAGVAIIYGFLWVFVLSSNHLGISITGENILIARRNLILPTVLFIASAILILIYSKNRKNNHNLFYVICLMLVVIVDLFRFGWKFTPFTKSEWIFPKTKIIAILQQDKNYFRVMALDRRILPPNFAAAYGIYDVSGYDPLYLKNYGQLVASWERNKPDISPASFNRILTPSNYENFISDLLGVKYILSMIPLQSTNLILEAQEGETYLYSNGNLFLRVFLAEKILKVENQQKALEKMYELKNTLRNTAVVTDDLDLPDKFLGRYENAAIVSYKPNSVEIRASVYNTSRLLVLSDIYYPTWKVFIDGKEAKILQVNFLFRGVVVPSGLHTVEFKNNLL